MLFFYYLKQGALNSIYNRYYKSLLPRYSSRARSRVLRETPKNQYFGHIFFYYSKQGALN